MRPQVDLRAKIKTLLQFQVITLFRSIRNNLREKNAEHIIFVSGFKKSLDMFFFFLKYHEMNFIRQKEATM